VALRSVEGFVRLLTHDVRNDLNALDLMAAYLAELAPPGEILAELAKMREVVRSSVARLRKVSVRVQEPECEWMEGSLRMLNEALLGRVRTELPSAFERLRVKGGGGEGRVKLDMQWAVEALLELVANAATFSVPGTELVVRLVGDCGWELQQVGGGDSLRGDPKAWGSVAFESSRRGGYGLGLFSTRRLLSAMGAVLSFDREGPDGVLRTRVDFARGAQE
jgi:signal transduction histidine kinase